MPLYWWKTKTEFISSQVIYLFAESWWNEVQMITNAEKPLENHVINHHEYPNILWDHGQTVII